MTFHNVPCPACGALVSQKLRCTKCNASWESTTALVQDGMTTTMGRANVIAFNTEWKTLSDAQPFWDAWDLYQRYRKELERTERR